jgi:large subunit ribosomal protein L17
VETTVARAKVARRLVERLITLSKKDSLASRRTAYSVLKDRDMVMKLFKEIAPLFSSRSSGFTRIIPIGFRRGDGASMCIFELTEKKIVEKLAKKKKEKKEVEAAQTAAPEQKTAVKSKSEEKRTEKARKEDRKITDKKGFMKNLRGFFRRKTDM